MPKNTDGKAIIGIADCGHAVLLDAETTPKAKAAAARKGLDVLTLPTEDAKNRFCDDAKAHHKTCCAPAQKELPL